MAVEQKSGKVFDLEKRTFLFAQSVRAFLRCLKSNESNFEDKKQLMRSSGSVAANYIEANEALGTKDFSMRLKISRKEAKESVLWLQLMKDGSTTIHHTEIDRLIQEGTELVLILSSIIQKFK